MARELAPRPTVAARAALVFAASRGGRRRHRGKAGWDGRGRAWRTLRKGSDPYLRVGGARPRTARDRSLLLPLDGSSAVPARATAPRGAHNRPFARSVTSASTVSAPRQSASAA